MLLKRIFKNNSKICREAYNADSLVQAKLSSGLWKQQPDFQPQSGLNTLLY